MCRNPGISRLTGLFLFVFLCVSSVWADSIVVFNEIMYHPALSQTCGEWVELHNQMAVDVDISGWSIKGSIKYTFPEGTFLGGGDYLVVAENPSALESASNVTGIFGPFEGQLSNGGELLKLQNRARRLMDSVEYNDKGQWPVAPDGAGVTLAKEKSSQASAPPENWTWSEQVGGTPTTENFPPVNTRPNRVELIKEYDSWRFNVTGSNLGQTWRQSSYDDSSWQAGDAGFYYGDIVDGETEPIATLFSSGLDDEGSLLSAGAGDPHYTFVSTGNSVIAMQNHPAWLANDSTSQWIGFSGVGTDSQPVGQFNIATTFDLTGYDPDSAEITLYLATDNRVDDVLVNGISTGISCADFSAWYGPYTINSGFIEGINELEFVFVNEGDSVNPAGLRVKVAGTAVTQLGRTELLACPTTTYYRRAFQYDKPNSSMQCELVLGSLVDDGAVFYLNGTEIQRTNMPSGAINYDDTAMENLTGSPVPETLTFDGDLLVDGENVLAVEVHQAPAGYGDQFFSASLAVIETPIIIQDEFKVAFNELQSGSGVSRWIEIVNYGSDSIDLAGTTIESAGSVEGHYVFQSETLAAGAYRVLTESQMGFYPADGDRLFLYAPGQTAVLDGAVVEDVLQGRMTAGVTDWYYPLTATPEQANNISLNSDVVINEIMYHKGDIFAREGQYDSNVLVAAGDAVKVTVPSDDSMGLDWTGGNEPFDDSGWLEGNTGAGYDQGSDYLSDIGIDIQTKMYNVNQTFYARISFNYQPSVVTAMTLEIEYDDGFIVYLNGQKIAERNAPTYPAWNSAAPDSHESYGYETIDVSGYIDSLQAGENILAIHGLNYGVTSSDLLILPQLTIQEELVAPVEADESAEEWIELYNRGDASVNLMGWKIDGGVEFDFTVETVLDPGEYLVVARDRDQMLADYPSITVVGNYDGRLSNTSETVTLLDSQGNAADEVVYYDDEPWPAMADGFNASLELRHPDADNTNAQSWAASDEGAKSQWQTYSYRGIAQASIIPSPDGQWREFVMGMLDAGQVLIDDIHVIEDPDGSAVELIQNGTFETSPGDSKWRMLGTHRHSQVIVDPDNAANHVLQFIATGPTEHMHNHLETTLADGLSIVNGREYEISFKARWISGSNQLNTRLYFNRLAQTTLIDRPHLNGTPGSRNSCYESNPGPVFTNLVHQPAVPEEYEPVTVSVSVDDPDGVSNVTLYWRQDGQTWNHSSMTINEQEIYECTLSSQAAGTVVQFYVQAVDQLGGISTIPSLGPDSRALYKVQDGLGASNGLHNLRLIMTEQDDTWMHIDINVMSNDRIGATVIYDEDEIFYDVGVRLKGSQHHRTPSHEVGFNIVFHADQLFRGVHKTVAIDRSQGVGFGQREMLINQAMNHAGTVVSKYTDLIKLIGPRLEYTSNAEMQLARFNDEYLNGQFEDGSSGYLYEYELIYYPIATNGGVEDYKLPLPDYVVGATITNLGEDKENYRWIYLGKNNRAWDPYEELIHFAGLFGDTSQAYYENLEDIIDVDEWLSSFAIAAASGSGDNYGGDNSQHNAMLYVRPSDGRVLYFPHDLDYAYDAYRSIVPNSDLNKMLVVPGYERLYYGYLYEFLTASYNTDYMSYWTDHFGQLLSGQDFASYLTFIGQRSQYLLSEINNRVAPAYAFEITDPNKTVDTDYAQVTGGAWIDVHEIYLDGIDSPLELEWSSVGTGSSKQFFWTATVSVEPGINELVFKAYGFKGQFVGTDEITITSTLKERPLRDFLKVTEIMYDPAGGTDYEFVELTNIGPIVLDLSHVIITDGIEFDFSLSSVTELNPGECVVVVKDIEAFSGLYDISSINIAGEYSGKLSNDGEKISLTGQWSAPILSLTYSDGRGWPLAADGAGHSLVRQESAANYSLDYGGAWRASTYINGSPGLADPSCPESVMINEIMAHTDYYNPERPEYDSNDWIELYNPTSTNQTLSSGDWYLSDAKDDLKKWRIPQTTIAAGGWMTFYEVRGFHYPITTGFGLDKAGEEVYLSYLPGNSEDRVVDCVRFKGQENNISLGRYPDGAAYWQAMLSSANAANLSVISHVIISEIMYHPLDGQSEFIELFNPTGQAVTLWDAETQSGWRLDGGISFTFTSNMSIPAGGHLLVIPFEPDETLVNQFVNEYGQVPSGIVGPYSGAISNQGERVALEKPEMADIIGDVNPWVIVDEVIFSDQSPWLTDADGAGASLWRYGMMLSGCNPEAWSSTVPSPGTVACDFNADGTVNLTDWTILGESWMEIPDGSVSMLKGDLWKTDDEITIDINDLIILIDSWLWENGD